MTFSEDDIMDILLTAFINSAKADSTLMLTPERLAADERTLNSREDYVYEIPKNYVEEIIVDSAPKKGKRRR